MVIYAWLVESLAQLGVFLTFKAPLPTTVASSSAQGDGSNFLIPPKWTVKYGDFYGFLTMGDPQHHPNLHQFLSERPMDFGIFTILRNTQTLGMRSLSGSIGSLFLSHRSSQMEGWQCVNREPLEWSNANAAVYPHPSDVCGEISSSWEYIYIYITMYIYNYIIMYILLTFIIIMLFIYYYIIYEYKYTRA